jgi:glycopeptide antibiotics resistance protein
MAGENRIGYNEIKRKGGVIMIRLASIGMESASVSVLLVPLLWGAIRLFRKNMPAVRKGMLLLFTVYLAGGFAATGMPTSSNCAFRPRLNLIPLADAVHEPLAYLGNTLLNILLFVPLGFFLPLLWRQLRSRKATALWGLGFSLSIELTQMFSGRLTDVDDLLTNTAGAVIGFYLAMAAYQRIAVRFDLHEGDEHGCGENVGIMLLTFWVQFWAR